MTKNIYFAFFIVCCAIASGCNSQTASPAPSLGDPDTDTSIAALQALLIEKERLASLPPSTVPGELVSTIVFDVKGEHTKEFQDGVQHWISLENPENDLAGLLNAEEIVIPDSICSIVIDYPLDAKVTYSFLSSKGFTRRRLAKRISELYHHLYEEEEATATVKTIPVEKRQGIYNRNATNGIYKIWGHDLADLVLSVATAYRSPNGRLILLLDIES